MVTFSKFEIQTGITRSPLGAVEKLPRYSELKKNSNKIKARWGSDYRAKAQLEVRITQTDYMKFAISCRGNSPDDNI